MDARPQRPLRALHIHGDENIAPHSKQTLHQRHKSTGTLSTMLGAGGLKFAAKRTAFGDVSNTVKPLNAVNDDLVTTIKGNGFDFQKPVLPLEKPSGFLRPAQRPLNVAGLKGLLSNTSSAISSAVTAVKPSASDLEHHQPQIGRPRALSKRVTTIYKDGTATEFEAASVQVVIPQPMLQTAGPIAPVHQNPPGPRHHKSQPQLKPDQPILRRTQSKHIGNSNEEFLQEFVHIKPSYLDILSDPIDDHPVEDHQVEDHPAEDHVSDPMLPAQIEEIQFPVETHIDIAEDNEHQDRQLPLLPLMSEPEEYWEEEEEEEVYDEQGYTTAHSYRSRGDNTTGGATTVLFPKVTSKVKKELAVAKDLIESSRTPEEIEDEAWDTSMVAEYGDEIFQYMRELEIKMLPNAHYMDNQSEIQWSMRSVLMDWLIQVHHRFSLLPETLFLCVNYIDRFLSCKIVSLGKLQLVGATAIFVAAKYEEINCPAVSEIVYMVDGGYTVDEILKAERFMLSMLQFELGWPGPMSFLRRISKADDYDLETRTLAKYFLEVTIMDERFVGSPPSFVAAGAHCLARLMLKKGDWSSAHVYYSGYTWTQLKPLVTMVMECCEDPQRHHAAVYEKYSDRRYKRASIFTRGEMEKGFQLPPTQPQTRPTFPAFEDIGAHMQYENRESFKRMVQVKG